MRNYSDAVMATMTALGTSISDWTAVPFVMREVDGRIVPETDFSACAGYTHAPVAQSDEACELCGHRIKNVYWLKCDARKWTMRVGSECVTHFAEGVSGAELEKEAAHIAKFSLVCESILRLKDLRDAMYAKNGSAFKWLPEGATVIHYRKQLKKVDYASKGAVTRAYNLLPKIDAFTSKLMGV